MTKALFIKVPSTFPSAPLLRDRIITNNTLYAFDFADTSCWPSQVVPVNGSSFANLTLSGTNAATAVLSGGSTFGFSGGGIVFDTQLNQYIDLPTSGMIPAGSEGFCYSCWFKPTSAGASFNTILDAGAQSQGYGLILLNGNYLRVYGPGADKYSSVGPGNMPLGVVTQLGAAIYRKIVGGNFFIQAVINGVPFGSEVDSGLAVIVAPTVTPKLGKSNGGLSADQGFAGSIYRVWCENYSAAGVTSTAMQAKLLLDYNSNVGRFS